MAIFAMAMPVFVPVRPSPHRVGVDDEEPLVGEDLAREPGDVAVDRVELASPAHPVERGAGGAGRLVDDGADPVEVAVPAPLLLGVCLDVVVLARRRVGGEVPPPEPKTVAAQVILVCRDVDGGKLAGHPRMEPGEPAHRRVVVAGGPPPHSGVDFVETVDLGQRKGAAPQQRPPHQPQWRGTPDLHQHI